MKKHTKKKEAPKKRRARGRLYYVLAVISADELKTMSPISAVKLAVERLNETGHVVFEVIETTNPNALEIREKHK